MNISLPTSLRAWVNLRVKQGGYGTASEFIRELLRQARGRESQARIDERLLESLDSGPTIDVTPGYWKAKRTALTKGRRTRKQAS
jgi:antitoxin ParD1/3/4